MTGSANREAVAYFEHALDALQHLPESRTLGEQAVDLRLDLRNARFGMTGLPSVFSGTILVSCLAECGEFAEGMTHGEDAMRIAEAVDEPFSLVRAYNALGHLAFQRGDFHQAISLIEQSLEVCRVWSFPVLIPNYTIRLGYCYALSGQLSTALPLLEQAR